MSRKKHPHPKLVPPKATWRIWFDKGTKHKEKTGYKENDEGRVINGRIFTYHPTKGWRNRRFA
jgi:hypothetical protein